MNRLLAEGRISSARLRALLLGVLAVASGACAGDEKIDCEPLKADAQQLKSDWAACADGDECVFITTTHDCTGELGCDTPVNKKVVSDAQADADRIASESQDCVICASPSCGLQGVAVCDAVAGKCVVE